MRFLAGFAMKGWLQTLLLTAIFSWLSIRFIPLALLSAGFGAMYTLRKGVSNGLMLFIIVAVITWAISLFVQTRPGLETPVVLYLYLPVLLCATTLLKTESQGYAVLIAVACGVIQAAFIEFFSGDAVLWWNDWIKHAITGVQGATYSGFEKDGVLQVFNGLVAMVLSMVTFLSVLLGRYLQASQVNPGGCLKEFCALQIPPFGLTLTLILAAIAYVISQNLMVDVLIIAMVMYFFQGLAVLHAIVINKGKKKSFLMPGYFLIIVAPQIGVVGFALVGIIDVFVNFRKLPKLTRGQN
jgi:hypothetical protein